MQHLELPQFSLFWFLRSICFRDGFRSALALWINLQQAETKTEIENQCEMMKHKSSDKNRLRSHTNTYITFFLF